MNEAISYSFRYQEGSLVKVTSTKCNSQWSILLIVFGLNIYVLVKEIEDREKVISLTSVVKQSPFVYVYYVKIDVFMTH